MTRSFRLLLAATVASVTGYVLLLPLVPLWAERGGADAAGAGGTTAAFMGTTVAAQLAMPLLLSRANGYRWTFPAGALLIALPTPLLVFTDALPAVTAISAARGIGFGLFTVAGSALAARLVPPRLIGRAAGLYGLAIGLPNLVFLPTGVGFALQFGFAPAFWAATAAPLLGAVLSLGVGGSARTGGEGGSAADGEPEGGPGAPLSPLRLLLRLCAPLAVMLALSSAAAAFLTFLSIPLQDTPAVAVLALLGYAAGALVTRWLAGELSDRYGHVVLIAPATASGALGAGLAAVALWTPAAPAAPVLAIAGATLFGAGFGAVQNDSIVVMFRRGGRAGYGTASAVWNIGFDGGTGVGAVVLGVAITAAGYGPAFLIAAVAVSAALPTAAVLTRAPRTRS
ncbi:MFS transporter [Nocardiopsis coralliicola]